MIGEQMELIHTKWIGQNLWMCVQEHCDGEHHYYVNVTLPHAS